MRILLPLHACILFAASPIHAQSADPAETADPAIQAAAIDQLLAERGAPDVFEKTVADARRTGVSEQAILEARFLYHVDRRDDKAIAAMLPDFLKQRDSFRPEDSAIFALTDDWLAAVEYVQAIHALGKNDRASFKKHITEAFWLSPGQAAAFAPHIERMRLDEAMRNLKIDLNITPAPLAADVQSIPLAKLIEGKSAMLLHFWSPWSRECEASLGDFITTATLLANHDIAVVSLLPEKPSELRDDALDMVRPHLNKAAGTWAIDPSSTSLARTLHVRNLPTMVLVSTEATVLFNGDPSDEALWRALRGIVPAIKRPPAPATGAE